MKKRTALMFSAGLFLIVLAVLFGLLMNGSLKSEGNIVLPQGSMQIEDTVDIAGHNQRVVREVTVRPDNVQAVVATLSRPVSYSYTAEKISYYPEGSASAISLLRVSGNMGRVDMFDTDGRIQKQLIYTQSEVYMWGKGDVAYYKGSRTSFSPEDEAGLPTYESVLSLDPNCIIDAGLTEHNGRLCIYLTSSYYDGRYTRDWYIDIDSGLLYSCDARDNGEVIWSVLRKEMVISEQDSSLFVLPNGQKLR